jgi:hypothetical protein
MKIVLLALLLSAAFVSAQTSDQSNPQSTSTIAFAGQLPRRIISPLTPEELTKLRQVYTAVLHDSPTLDAEGDAISVQMNAYRTALKAAMVKTDPALAPMLEMPSSSALTQAQRDEVSKAQSDALQSDPNLQSRWDDLAKDMTAHQQKVDAAMVQLDASMAPILAKLSP